MAKIVLPSPRRRTSSSPKPTEVISVENLSRFSHAWIVECRVRGYSKATISNYQILLDKLIWFLQTQGYTQIHHVATTDFMLYLRADLVPGAVRWNNALSNKPLRPQTILTYKTRYTTFFSWLHKQKLIAFNPFAEISNPIARQDQIAPFTKDQVKALIKACADTYEPERNKAVLYLMIDTGCRLAEVVGLNYGDVNFGKDQTTIRVLGKGNKVRTIPMGNTATRALLTYLRQFDMTEREPLFRSALIRNNRFTRSGVKQLFERLKELTGVTNVRCSPHTMRHTFSIEFLRNGGNVYTLQAMLGHEDLETCRRYVAVADADMERQHKKCSPGDNLK